MSGRELSKDAEAELAATLEKYADRFSSPNDTLIAVLRALADRVIPKIEDVEIRNAGVDAFDKSHNEHRIAVELQRYAKDMLGPDISGAVAKLPATTGLDGFLGALMSNTGATVRREKFVKFLTHEAETRVDELMELRPSEASREERVAEMVRARLKNLERNEIPALAQYDIREAFTRWCRTLDSNVAKHNATKAEEARNRREAMLAVLPSQSDKAGITSSNWKSKITAVFSSESTFRRDVDMLVAKGLVIKQTNGNYRKKRQEG